ncbi:hypothetical protein [Chitinophaga sancti]|uniref:Uncharacterized protein n=1 Tax=Chitinophaga sancti TaxID=1004 RepID=A0A1K1RYI9_9BACT|nr:hypothetical protein [Chitinophaga sancti]WQD64081.1 hypothetical protein U0033_06705 [Chitinophaga sancti]WQG90295.1 hypothetical protein SR876_02215 [Chitinophaga sancti]SFW76909.1 hypothetical protein SAMN05661012_04435 [Chitinophaga sancti]
MQQCATLEHPAEIVAFLTNVVGKEKIKDIRFGYRLQNDEPAIKFKITLRFPYNMFGKKKIEELVGEQIKYIQLAAELPAKLLFSIV